MSRWPGMLRAAAAALLLAPALAWAPAAPASAEERSAAAPDADDRDGNDVVDTLDQTIDESPGDDPVDVIVMLDRRPSDAVIDDQQDDVGEFEVDQRIHDLNAYVATVTAEQAEELAARSDVDAVHENAEVRATLDTASTEFGVTKARTDFLVDGGDGVAGYSTNDIVVAVIDTGIDATHDDLDGDKVLAFGDFIAGGCDSSPTTPAAFDDNGHGTHVASIVAGEGQLNGRAIGVAPGAALVGLKVLDSSGSGSTTCVAAGIKWAIDNKATYSIDVINLSLGTDQNGSGNDLISQRVDEAVAAGITVVVAAGNSGPGVGTVGSPAVARDAITVGNMADPKDADGSSTNRGFRLQSTSSRGPTTDGRIKPDLVAPGVEIFAAVPGDAYALKTGTSMASPFVAGVAALMLDAAPGTAPTTIKSQLKDTAEDWGPAGADNDYGAGRLQANGAIDAASPASGGNPTTPLHVLVGDCLVGTNDVDDWSLSVSSTTWPIAVTLLMSGSGLDPDVDLLLFAPGGAQVDSSLLTGRTEVFGSLPAVTGIYTLRVKSAYGAGSYTIDTSGPTSVSGGADGCAAPAVAPNNTPTTIAPTTPVTAPPVPAVKAPGDGYVLIDDKGGLFSFGSAPFLGSIPQLRQSNPGLAVGRVAGAFPTHAGSGYIAYDDAGRAFAFGAARHLGSVHDRVQAGQLGAVRIVTAFPTNGGNGYVMVDDGGGVHTFGAASYLGSVTDLRAAGAVGPATIVSGFAVDDGRGYVLIDSVGGLFAFGSARFLGSVPALRNAGIPIGPARIIGGFSIDNGSGYVMIDDVGGLFAFGSARFFGSVPGLRDGGIAVGPATVMGGFSVDNGNGYVMIDDVGGLFAFGSARFFGSVPGLRASGVSIGPATVIGGFAV